MRGLFSRVAAIEPSGIDCIGIGNYLRNLRIRSVVTESMTVVSLDGGGVRQ